MNAVTKIISNPLNPNVWKKFALGQKGMLGVALSTVVLEFATQALEKYVPQTRGVMDRQLVQSSPFLGRVDVRDAIVLGPAISSGVRGVTDKSGAKMKRFMEAGVGYGTNVLLRSTGLNPNLLSKASLANAANPRVTGGLTQIASNTGVYP